MKALFNSVFGCFSCFFSTCENIKTNDSNVVIQSFLFVDHIFSKERLHDLFSGNLNEEISDFYSKRWNAKNPRLKIFNNLRLLVMNNFNRCGAKTGQSYILALSGNVQEVKKAIDSCELHKLILGAMEYNNAYQDIATARNSHGRLLYDNNSPMTKEDLQCLGFIENPFFTKPVISQTTFKKS